MKLKNILLFPAVILLTNTGCEKYLDEKSDKSLVIPASLMDLQALLDNENYIQSSFVAAGEVSADDYYLTDASYNALTYEEDKRMYTWQKSSIFTPITTTANDWSNCFRAIYVANSVIDLLPSVTGFDTEEGNNIKGQALLWRAFRHLDAAQVWCKHYQPETAASDPGLPLRYDPDFNQPSTRSSVMDTYNSILRDLRVSVPLLPVIPLSPIRPSRPAAYALLSRTSILMGDYEKALAYADSCLQLNNSLIDYNTLTASASYPVKDLNDEVLLKATTSSRVLTSANVRIAADFYNSYDPGDLRRTIFFSANTDSSYRFKGNYTGGTGRFTGISTNEIYLIRAECLARSGRTQEAMTTLNFLLEKRWNNKKVYVPVLAANSQDALMLILKERRKELLFRGIRWMDIRRLAGEGQNAVLTRSVNGEIYTLSDFVLPIPEDVIQLAGIQQN